MIFSLDHLSVRHPGAAASGANGASALRDVTLAARPGEQIALIGPSGAGKTTLLHTLAVALCPSQGNVTLFDNDPWELSSSARHALRSRLFLAPQTPPLPPRQRVVNAVLAGLLPQWSIWQALRSLIKPIAPVAAFEALARFNLQDKLYARVDRLSGGERQRCGMARLLISKAQLLLVDEPLSALDPTLSLQTLAVLQQEAGARQATLVCSLHQVELARTHFPRIVGLRDGAIMFDLPREQVTDGMIDALYRGVNEVESGTHFDDESGVGLSLTDSATYTPRC
ncbi:phosphonate ABC transporter ATP-binding protein [Glaciimonas soli]|uniref:ATP-binding cassette domain-containing protein n=1 Tax=Glaciimonas soli TaxID=2590999 RepID=A0A843YJH0_9BURK|nr:ATP-binding cassette domain-containing protein [Glaciimonas soli]MQQ99928.1 ATP-binding cassette domain-containing protein [Glaciimonas soli]